MQRAGMGAASPPSRFQSALNQACRGKGEPRASGFLACPVCQDHGDPAHVGRSCLPPVRRPARSGRPRVPSRGARWESPRGRACQRAMRTPEATSARSGLPSPWPAPLRLGAGHRWARGEKHVGAAVSVSGRSFGITGAWRSVARAAEAVLPIRIGAWGARGGRQPRPRSSRTSNKQSVWRGRGGGEPCSNGRSVRHAPRYLECPGQHPHRDSLHGLPLLEMRRAQLVLAHWRTGRRQRGRKHGPTLRRRLWAQGPPAAPASEHQ